MLPVLSGGKMLDIQYNHMVKQLCAGNLSGMTLNQLIECGIISKNVLDEKLITTAKVLQQHKYKITEPKDSNSYWRTHYIDGNGSRKNIKCKTKGELVKRLVAIYTGINKARKITFQKPITNITEIYLEMFLNNMVKNFNITHKEYGNVKGVVNGMFECAVRMKYLRNNIVPKHRVYFYQDKFLSGT